MDALGRERDGRARGVPHLEPVEPWYFPFVRFIFAFFYEIVLREK